MFQAEFQKLQKHLTDYIGEYQKFQTTPDEEKDENFHFYSPFFVMNHFNDDTFTWPNLENLQSSENLEISIDKPDFECHLCLLASAKLDNIRDVLEEKNIVKWTMVGELVKYPNRLLWSTRVYTVEYDSLCVCFCFEENDEPYNGIQINSKIIIGQSHEINTILSKFPFHEKDNFHAFLNSKPHQWNL